MEVHGGQQIPTRAVERLSKEYVNGEGMYEHRMDGRGPGRQCTGEHMSIVKIDIFVHLPFRRPPRVTNESVVDVNRKNEMTRTSKTDS